MAPSSNQWGGGLTPLHHTTIPYTPPPQIVLNTGNSTHDCKQTDEQHNSGSECQIPRQLDSQTRQSMFNANRRLSAGTGVQQ